MADTKISGLTTDSAPARAADYVPTYDASAVATKKVLLNNLGVIPIYMGFSNSSPADSTTYYFGAWDALALTTSASARVRRVPRAGILTRADVFIITSGGTTETSTMSIRLNATSDTTITSTLATSANGVFSYTFSCTVALADFFEIKWVTPAWATNPTGLYMSVQLLLE